MKHFLLLVYLVFSASSVFGQLNKFSFEHAEKLKADNSRPYVVFVHTSWCKYCKLMENTTFKNPETIRLLNDNFYFISFDAESTDEIRFNNRLFSFKPSGQNTGIHELAVELATINKSISYPTITILNSKREIIAQTSSYLDSKTMNVFLEKCVEGEP